MVTAAIFDAADNALRLPDRALRLLGMRTVLAHAVTRARAIPGVDFAVALLPPDGDPAYAEEAGEAGAMAVDPPHSDPLTRLAAAAAEAGADRILYIRSAHPFIDPVIAGGVLGLLSDARADFASNTLPPGFPQGLDCEAFAMALLVEADRAAVADERADPTAWMRRRAGLVRANLNGPAGGLENLRWVLEREEDLAFFAAVFAALGPKAGQASAAEIAGLCLRRPDITAINAPWADTRRLVRPERAALQSAPVRLMFAA